MWSFANVTCQAVGGGGGEPIPTTAKKVKLSVGTYRACIFKRLWSPGIDSKELIPPAYEAWACMAGRYDNPNTLFLPGS